MVAASAGAAAESLGVDGRERIAAGARGEASSRIGDRRGSLERNCLSRVVVKSGSSPSE